jgi:hypothetical protein
MSHVAAADDEAVDVAAGLKFDIAADDARAGGVDVLPALMSMTAFS